MVSWCAGAASKKAEIITAISEIFIVSQLVSDLVPKFYS